jgi:prefoldin subunit 5
LKNYSKDDITEDLSSACKELFKDPNFEDKALKGASQAVYGIGRWCKAIIKYDEAMKIVRPKEAELKIAKESLASAEATLAEAQARLDEINAKL